MGKTINVFISQPMKDKTREEIIKERYKTIAWIYEDLAKATHTLKDVDKVNIIDSYFGDNEDVKNAPVWCLGEAIKLMSNADYVVFCNGWKDARGCRIERTVANEYGIPCVDVV